MSATAITVRVPATSANLGAGFDCLGLALDVFAEIVVTFGGPEPQPAEDVGEKMVVTAARHAFARLQTAAPAIRARYAISVPLGRGMGASAVARVAGVLAANEFAGRPLDAETCMSMAADLEGHGDNACPAMFGGVQVCIKAGERYLHAAAAFPDEVQLALLIPDHSMPTKEARRVLPDSYSREDAVHNIGRAALFVAALASRRFDLLDEATNDVIHQRQRAAIFPPLFEIFRAAKAAGAHAAWLSGAGSTVAALCTGDTARPVAAAMLETLRSSSMPGRSLVTRIASEGASVPRIELVDEAAWRRR
jgi:homoserine kinase